ncbi:universal stress protein [Ferrimonas marina]|uniref:Nucleotide-binding universal stress protein, UspA family n=1 Tax=Ferrimonas marina TaxID=299255 RepID=A0A1M5RR26_9GAMM|nr:universal stress protein [Ferrimonas marina]SHH28694.1 Nucleotide-binding universal stress protein, UspA family [Ferrimonas marina]
MQQESILVPLAQGQTLSERSAPLLTFAEISGAQLTLLTVVENIQMVGSSGRSLLDMLKLAMQAQREVLDAQAYELRLQYPSLKIDTEVISGKPFIEIVKYADKINASLIAIDVSRRHKESACQYGSTTRHLMRKSQVPLWVLSPSERVDFKKVVAAVDIVTCDPETQHMNEQIVQRAHAIAQQQGAQLQVCHVWRLDAEGYLRTWGRYSETEIATVAQQEEHQRMMRLEALLARLGLSTEKVPLVMLEGDAKTEISAFVNRVESDLLVMGTLARSGIAGFLMGNTAERVIDEVHCSVLTLKPEGFRSPILEVEKAYEN